MADLDLTEAVDAAARRLAAVHHASWNDLPVMDQHTMREVVTPLVAAAAPVIAAQALAPIEALHRPRDVQAITARDCVHEVCGHEDACPTSPVATCAHCWDIAERVNAYFAEDGIPEEVLWPCPTAAALASIKGQPS